MKILLKLGWAPSLVPDPVLLFYSCTISEIAGLSLGTILLQVPLQLIKGKKKKKPTKKRGGSSFFSACLLKTCLCWAETHRVPHKEVWFQCHGFPCRTSMHPHCCHPTAATAGSVCLFLAPFLQLPALSAGMLSGISPIMEEPLFSRLQVFSAFFSPPPILLWNLCHKLFYIALIHAGDSKGTCIWQSFGGQSEADPDPGLG